MIDLAPRPRALRILCVEEDDLERRLLQACMDAIHAEAIFARDAADAVRYFREHPVDMVFIDIDCHSPGELGGFRRMRATPGRGKKVPILAVTDNDCRWSEKDYRETGFAELFLKPIEPSRLFQVIDDVLYETHQPPLLA
ncbi:MAG: response regulator, partial [Proteobacteria bacterium]|nr:response regulator [Pseudomonadota bacterium]